MSKAIFQVKWVQTVLDILVQLEQALQLSSAAAVGNRLMEMDSLPEIKEGVFIKQSKAPLILLDIRPPRLLDQQKVELGIASVQVGDQLHVQVEHSDIVHTHCFQHSLWIDHCLNTVH